MEVKGAELGTVKHIEEQIWDFHFVNTEMTRVRGTRFRKSFSIMCVSKNSISTSTEADPPPSRPCQQCSAILFFHYMNSIDEDRRHKCSPNQVGVPTLCIIYLFCMHCVRKCNEAIASSSDSASSI